MTIREPEEPTECLHIECLDGFFTTLPSCVMLEGQVESEDIEDVGEVCRLSGVIASDNAEGPSRSSVAEQVVMKSLSKHLS
jgi:hypothetical protein